MLSSSKILVLNRIPNRLIPISNVEKEYHLRCVILVLLNDRELTYLLPGHASLQEGSLLFISEISEADSARFNKMRFLGGRR